MSRTGQYISIVSCCDMRQDIVTDFGYCYIVICRRCCLGWKGVITVKWCDFLNLLDCSYCAFIYLHPLSHITDDYLSKNVIGLLFCEITIVILPRLSQYQGIWSKILWYLLILSPYLLPPLQTKSSVTTYMINNYSYWLIWNFTIMIGFSAVLPRPNYEPFSFQLFIMLANANANANICSWEITMTMKKLCLLSKSRNTFNSYYPQKVN